MRPFRVAILFTPLILLTTANAPAQEPDLSEGPVYVARDTEPKLKNETVVRQALMRSYPDALRLTGQDGTVIMWLLVEEDGTVGAHQVLVSGGNEAFDEAAQQVAEVMEFEPATRDGEPVAVWIQQAVKFKAGDLKIREQ
jgi:TonB family protein